MPPDEDGEGRGQGLAMLRLEARRYKREMQKICMQRQLHEQKKFSASISSEDSSRVRDERWRFSDTFTNFSATSGTPMFWNREEAHVSCLEQLAIVEEGTQTDTLSKSEVQIEAEKLQYDDDLISSMRESKTMLSTASDTSMLKTCSRHCDELRSRISQEAACECLANPALRVNADVVFTAKPKQVFVEGQVETPHVTDTGAFQPTETGIISHTSTTATSPTGSLNKGKKNTNLVEDHRTGLRSLVSPMPQYDSACSPIHNLHEYEARFKRLGDTSKGTTPFENFSSQQNMSALVECSSIVPPAFSTQVSTPQPEASYGDTKAEGNTSDFFAEISGSKQIRSESTGEGSMAAKLATKIKHALEAISRKTDTISTNANFNFLGQAIQSTSACRLHYKDQRREMKLFGDGGESCGGGTLNDKELTSSESNLHETCQHARKVPVSFSQHHTNNTPCSDADIYFQNVMAALYTNRYTSNKLSSSGFAGEVSPAGAAKRDECRTKTARRADFKSCGDHHSSHQLDGIEDARKTNVHQSGSKHVMEKHRLLSNVQKLQNVAETAKRLYTDLVDCAYDELRASTGCGNLVKHQDGDRARDACNFPRSKFCPSAEIISAHRADVASVGNNEVCGRCHVCQPQFGNEQLLEEAQTDSLDEITIELSDNSPTNIMVSRNDYTERPGYNVEVSTSCDVPCQRVCSPNNQDGNIFKRGNISWKDSYKPAMRRTRPARPDSNQQVKQGFNKCLLDPRCNGFRDSCHMPTRGKCSGASSVCITPPKKGSNKNLVDPHCDGPGNSCHMPTHAKCSGATTICISPPKKDSNMCCLDPRCVGSRDSCHMPTYAKSSRANCRPSGSSSIKRNNGMKLDNKDPSGLSQCLVHHSRGMEPVKGKLESNPCCGRFLSAGNDHTNSLHDENPSHIFLHERKYNSPVRCSKDISKFPKGCLDEIPKVGTLSETIDHRNLCMVHNDVRSSSMKGKDIEIGNGDHEETTGLYHSSSERMDHNNPVKNVHRSFQECSQFGVVKNHPTLTTTENIEKEPASVGKETKKHTVRHMTGNASALSEACTQTTQLHTAESDNLDRAVAAAGLAKDIEVMIAHQLGKSNPRIREKNYLKSQHKISEDQKFGQTKLDVAVRAAANAVKKLKPISLLPLVKQDGGNHKATPRKGRTLRAKLTAEDTIGSSFYDQMYKELEELSSERMQLVRQERAQFRSDFFFLPHQHFSQDQDKHAGPSIKGRSSSELKNLANAGSELEESRRSVRMQRSEECPRFWDEPIGSHTPGSKRQRSATSPAREHGNKLLRLSIGKAESQAGRKTHDPHSTLSTSLNQGVRKSNKGLDRVPLVNFETLSSGFSRRKGRVVSELDVEKFNGPLGANFGLASPNRMSTSSLGRWKLAPKEALAKTNTKTTVFTTQKIRPPAWVDRMSKAKNVFSSFLRPLLVAHFRKEPQVEATIHRRTSRPPGLIFRSSITSKQFGKHIPIREAFSLEKPNPSRIHSKKSIAPIQYDISTGRKIVYSEQEPGELLHTRVENRHVHSNFKTLHEKNIRITKHPIVKHGMMPSAMANLDGNHVRIRGWNADPLIRSDIPHKPADIIRYNKNGGLDVQVHRRDASGKHKLSTSTSVRQMNIRHVTFAGMIVHNSRSEKTRAGFIAPQSIDSLETQVAGKKASTSASNRVKRALGKRRSSSATKIPPMQGKLHRYGGGGGKWTYHEGFWKEMFKCELEKVSQGDSLQSLPTHGSISQPNTPILELRTTQVIENDTLHKPAERAGAEDLLTVESSLLVKKRDEEDVTSVASEKNSWVENAQSSATNFELKNGFDVQRSDVFIEDDGESQNPDLFKSMSVFRSDGLEGCSIIDHCSVVATKIFLSHSQNNEEDEQAKSSFETKSTIMSERQAQVNIIDYPDHHDDLEQREPRLSSKEFPQSPLRLLDDVFPDNTENEALVSMFDCVQSATSVHFEAHLEEQHPASEYITQRMLLDTHDHKHKGQLRKLELERTLMDLALHTILHDDPLQVQEVSATRIEPISLPINRRMAIRAHKEVEAIVHSHDMSQSPLSKPLLCVDKSTEQDIIPHVDRATELDNSSLFSKDQDSQTTDFELRIQKIQKFTSATQEKRGAKLQSTQVHHQETECHIPSNSVGIEIPDTTATISTASPSPLAAMPMLMPVFFQQLGTSMLPIVFPSFNFELPARITNSSNLQPPPVNTISRSFQVGVDQGTQATEPHIQPNPKEIAAQVHHQVSNLPINNKAALGQLSVREEESDSDWEESNRGSSPSTPSTPLSSPDHKISLKKAMHLYPDASNIQETAFAKKDPQTLVSEVCQVSKSDGLWPHQTLVNEVALPIQVVTEMIMEEIRAKEPPLITSANETRRGTSWANVKEMEEAALTLLRAASMKTPSVTSSSECSRETSPEVYTWMSPGEVNIEEVGRSSVGGRFLNNGHSSEEHLNKLTQSHAWSWFNCGRTSIGEVYNPICFLQPLSEGEIEAGIVPSLGELGQIRNGHNLASHSTTDLQGQGSEPGECHVDADASSPQKSPIHQIVS